jgi:uncharacterized protein
MLYSALMLAFMVVAFVYASVGFGGGSSYLAILAMAALPFPEIRVTALLCNIVVVMGNSILFAQRKQLNWRKCVPLILCSVPMAFLGAMVPMRETMFFGLLGVVLVLASVVLWFQPNKQRPKAPPEVARHPIRDSLLGASIGWLSGLVGIGGGIFLSPILHFLRWDDAKKIAAMASLFILANSFMGLVGQLMFQKAVLNWPLIIGLALAVATGGQLGLRVSLTQYSEAVVRKWTAAVVLFAGLEVLWKHIFVAVLGFRL